MKHEVFRAALEATARVACCATLIGSVGCQPKQQVDTKPVDKQSVETKTEVKIESEAEKTPERTEDPRAAMIEAAKQNADSDFLACQEKVAEQLKKTAQSDPNQVWPEEVVKCCDLQAQAVDGNPELGILFEREACCFALNWQGSRACTPWGPPMPPKMV